MIYQLVWNELAIDDLRTIDKIIQQRIIKKVRLIEERPFVFVDRLTGFQLFKLRIGDYRAILDINNKENKIIVILVGHRSKVYTELRRRIN